MNQNTLYSASTQTSVLQTNKVLRNTYSLLAMTLVFSAICAGITMSMNMPPMGALAMTIGAFICLFIVNKQADKASGLAWIFVFTGLMGGALGPLLNVYMGIPQGPELVMQAFGLTALVFFGLSGYALTTKKDFSFMGGFLMVGLIIAVVAMIANIFLALPALSLAISAAVVFIMSGLILFDTSRIVNGGETNYIRATVSLYLNIYNLFVHLLSLLTAFGSDD